MDPSWPQTQRQHQAMTSNWRCTPAWRSHRGGTNAWHGEETQGALSPWRNSDESSVWQTDDSWHLWDSHSGGKNGWHGEGASHSETDGSPTAVASQAPSGDSWHWRMSDDSSSSLGDPIGMARFFKPRRRETKETKDDLEAQVQGMHDCLVALAARMQKTEEALMTAKEEARAARERIVNLEAQVQALQEATCDAPQPAGVARDAPQLAGVLGDAPQLAGVGGPSLAASGSHQAHLELREAPPCDQWHESRPHAKPVAASTGEPVGKADDWLHHLRNTLFVDDTRVLDQLEDKIKCFWPYMEVLACKTKANRFLYVSCIKCRQFSYGSYGNWADSEAPQRARDDLAKFFKLEVTGDGARHV